MGVKRLTCISFAVFILILSSFDLRFQWTLINFQLEKHGICNPSCIWIWIHIVYRGFNMQCNIRILEFLHLGNWYGLSTSNLECTKSKQQTSLQTECRTLLIGRNSVAMQIASSHVNSCEEMKKGNCSIHIGIIIWNFLGFKYWTQTNLFYFGISFFLESHFLAQH